MSSIVLRDKVVTVELAIFRNNKKIILEVKEFVSVFKEVRTFFLENPFNTIEVAQVFSIEYNGLTLIGSMSYSHARFSRNRKLISSSNVIIRVNENENVNKQHVIEAEKGNLDVIKEVLKRISMLMSMTGYKNTLQYIEMDKIPDVVH